MRKIIFFVALSFTLNSFSQEVKCDELINYVVKNGTYKDSVFPTQLINSSWLKKVEAYSIEDKIVVIAEIDRDGLTFNNKKYIFCGIPSANWYSFYIGLNDINKTYGERFHKYIINYECDCN